MSILKAIVKIISKIFKCSKCTPLVITALAIGCTTQQRYVEGTMTQIGLYVPVDGEIFGFQCLNYLNGMTVQTYTNQPMVVSREYVSSNSYFGVIYTTEHSKTEVEVKK